MGGAPRRSMSAPQRPVSLRDVASATGLSRTAVSLALRNDPQISAPTRARVKAAATRLGYARNPVVGALMARMRAGPKNRCRLLIGLVNGHRQKDAFTTHPTIPRYVEGIERRARTLGYGLDRFWLHEPNLGSDRWCSMLASRGVQGLILVGIMGDNRIPAAFTPVLERFPSVVTGVRTISPVLPFASVDHYILSVRAMDEALALGYRRPALVLDQVIDDLVEGRFSAGFRQGQKKLPKTRRIPPFFEVAAARADRSAFFAWMKRYRPDCLFTLYHEVGRWVAERGLVVPHDIALVQLERRPSHPDWAGMNQHNDIAGEAALDMVVSMIHSGEPALPTYPRSTLIGPTWHPGPTAPGCR